MNKCIQVLFFTYNNVNTTQLQWGCFSVFKNSRRNWSDFEKQCVVNVGVFVERTWAIITALWWKPPTGLHALLTAVTAELMHQLCRCLIQLKWLSIKSPSQNKKGGATVALPLFILYETLCVTCGCNMLWFPFLHNLPCVQVKECPNYSHFKGAGDVFWCNITLQSN